MAVEPTKTTKAAPKKPAAKSATQKAPAKKPTAKTAASKAVASSKAAPKKPAAKKPATKKAAPKNTTTNTAKGFKMSLSDMTTDAKAKASQWKDEASKYTDQASVRAKELATEGKTKTAGAMGSLAQMIEDAAPQVDEKLGTQYGDFARSAAKTVSGMASTLDQQDVDQLVNNTRDFVKKSPAVAIGAAAVVGFVLARMFKSSNDDA
ncbi:hypothetical protein DMP17_04285 [Pseudonocardia sp. TMWB2A]|uniref:hypothetical protein n=1 Tax=Pseudonocardia sp. TMWB2A TaxID=687430 RepID=UPI00307D92DB